MAENGKIIIRGGSVVDGTGSPAFNGDVAVENGRITEVGGSLDATGAEVVEADGALVAPGWVDVHTHYDGQVTWDDTLDPSFSNGVTTLVMGNCGVGFAPCPAGEQQKLIELMEGVEDIPGAALAEGVPWGAWESFPEYLDFLATRSYAMDVGAQLAHGSLRFAVMGDRVDEDHATDDDIAQMRRLASEAIAAGAMGFSTSRTIFHRAIDGTAVPGTYATDVELGQIAAGMVEGGGGVFEAITSSSIGAMESLGGERFDAEHELALLAKISRESGLNVTFTTVQNLDYPDAWRDVLAFSATENNNGAKLYPQVASRPIGLLSGLSGYHPYMRRRAYLDIAHLPVAERAAAMRTSDVRAAILASDDIVPDNPGSMEMLYSAFQGAMPYMFPLVDGFDYEPGPEDSFAARASAAGVELETYVYDFLTNNDGAGFAALMGANYIEGSLDAIREMLLDPNTITGLADGGAHVKLICDGSMPTTQLKHWGGGRTRGEGLPIEFLVEKQTRRNAQLYGLTDRGTLQAGMKADINIIDLDNLTVAPPVAHADLPAGGWRLLQPVTGYAATMQSGTITRRNDEDTGARPGQLLRR